MQRIKLVICILLSIVPLVYLAFVWHRLPAIVPTHFDARGRPNGYSTRGMLWAINGFLSAMTVGMFLLFNNLHLIDPKRQGNAPLRSFSNLADGLALFLSVINFIAILACTGYPIAMTKLVFPMVGLLFVFIGNMMFSLKPNYFAGIRLPWTLADDNNWRATHRVAGVVWFVCGLIITATALILGSELTTTILLIALAPMILIPTVYSFWYYKRSHADNN